MGVQQMGPQDLEVLLDFFIDSLYLSVFFGFSRLFSVLNPHLFFGFPGFSTIFWNCLEFSTMVLEPHLVNPHYLSLQKSNSSICLTGAILP